MQLNPNLPEVLAVKGWLLTEEFRFDEALPLLQRATQLNPNDASSHRFLGNLYDRRAQPERGAEPFLGGRAASIRMDFISHVFRCMELIDLGDFEEADAACKRARELDPTNMWGPLTTAWIARAQGKTDEALQWMDAARKLAAAGHLARRPEDRAAADAGKIADARAVLARAAGRDSFFGAGARGDRSCCAEGGAATRSRPGWPNTTGQHGRHRRRARRARAHCSTSRGDAAAARATLAHAERILPLSTADLFDGSQIRHEYSAALIRAGIELRAAATRRGPRIAAPISTSMLDTYEKNGGRHFGLYHAARRIARAAGKKAEARGALDDRLEDGLARDVARARRSLPRRQSTDPGK